MNKKTILILMKTMNIGGAERSLLGLLNAIDYDNYDVTVKLYHHTGDFLKYMPNKVTLLPPDLRFSVFEIPIKSLLFSKRWKYGLARILAKIDLTFYCLLFKKNKNTWINQQYSHKYLVPLLPTIEGEYDLAINFLGISDVLTTKVQAKVKASWIHTDYDQLIANRKMDIHNYSKLDYIVNVSEDCNKVFLKHYPQFKNRTIVVENILSETFIEEQSRQIDTDKEMPKVEGCSNLLSIGRFGRAKNFDNIPDICRKILDKGMKIKWYIIGYGNDEQLIKDKIIQFNVSQHVIILGKKENPYPYIKACDIYIQPSRYEGKAVTVREAQILHKPVVITNYETASSQLTDGFDGIILPIDNKDCAYGIAKEMINSTRLNNIVENCRKSSFSNKSEIVKIYSMFKNFNIDLI